MLVWDRNSSCKNFSYWIQPSKMWGNTGRSFWFHSLVHLLSSVMSSAAGWSEWTPAWPQRWHTWHTHTTPFRDKGLRHGLCTDVNPWWEIRRQGQCYHRVCRWTFQLFWQTKDTTTRLDQINKQVSTVRRVTAEKCIWHHSNPAVWFWNRGRNEVNKNSNLTWSSSVVFCRC